MLLIDYCMIFYWYWFMCICYFKYLGTSRTWVSHATCKIQLLIKLEVLHENKIDRRIQCDSLRIHSMTHILSYTARQSVLLYLLHACHEYKSPLIGFCKQYWMRKVKSGGSLQCYGNGPGSGVRAINKNFIKYQVSYKQ